MNWPGYVTASGYRPRPGRSSKRFARHHPPDVCAARRGTSRCDIRGAKWESRSRQRATASNWRDCTSTSMTSRCSSSTISRPLSSWSIKPKTVGRSASGTRLITSCSERTGSAGRSGRRPSGWNISAKPCRTATAETRWPVGHWRCPPGERFAAEFGLSYRLRSSSEIDWVLQRNLRFLNDYLIKPPLVDQQTAETVLALVKQRPGLQLAALLDTLGEAQVDDIYTLIVSGRIYVDLHAAALAEAQHVQLFADQETARAYVMVDNARTIAGGIAADIPQLLAEANPADLREANRRHAIITPYLAGVDTPSPAASARTIRRWLAQWRLAEQGHGCGYLGLLPKWRQRGNRNRKLPEATLALIDEFLTSEYETLKQKRKFVVYAALQRACDARGLIAPSYPTFVRYANHRPRHRQIARRQGPRAAAEAAPFYWELNLTTPRHGDRPFEIGHLDHTQLDVELFCSPTGRNLRRPWT